MRHFRLCAITCFFINFVVMLAGIVYWPGLSGGWLFDDYPNIVDNPGVQPTHISIASLTRAILSSPASDFKRPLASLSFALNYLLSGLDPYSMKLTNLVIHLLNGVLVFFLSRLLLAHTYRQTAALRITVTAALVAAGWLLLPINLTAVLYVVQRMESMANLFVLIGLIGYVVGRQRMLDREDNDRSQHWGAFAACVGSLTVPTAVGVLAKETAVMLPLYAFLIEWVLFCFRKAPSVEDSHQYDSRLFALFFFVLILPAVIGLAWLLPGLLKPGSWITRDFTLKTRLLSESRVVLDYIAWTLVPLPHNLSFYHDNFQASTGLFSPWTTFASMVGLVVLTAGAIWLRKHRPLVTLGILLFLGCHLLTGTILPLELVYEHRNYFASFGLLLAAVPVLVSPVTQASRSPFSRVLGPLVLGCLMLTWMWQTAYTAEMWGEPLRLAQELARRAPDSPRAQYELGRTYIIYSQYDPSSPYTKLAYAPLERAAALPASSILPQQALIFMNSRMHLPLKDSWWDTMIAKLASRQPGVQDESSLSTLVQCARDESCDLPQSRMVAAFNAALSHPHSSSRLLASYSDYAWNVLDDRALGEQLIKRAVDAAPNEPAYRITLVRMLAVNKELHSIEPQMEALQRMNIGGRLNDSIRSLQQQIDAASSSPPSSGLNQSW